MLSGRVSHIMFTSLFLWFLLASQKFGTTDAQFLEALDDVSKFMYNSLSKNGSSISTPIFKEFYSCSTKGEGCQSFILKIPPSIFEKECNSTTCRVLNKCSTSSQVLDLLNNESTLEKTEFSFNDFNSLLPFVVLQSEYCRSAIDVIETMKKPSPAEVWGFGILFVTLISLCSLAGVSVLPFMAKKFYQAMLSMLIGLAVGSLASSALFHLIPQAFNITATNETGHQYLIISLTVLGGIWMFFLIETGIKSFSSIYHQREENALSNSVSVQGFVDGRFTPIQSVENFGIYDEKQSSNQKAIEVSINSNGTSRDPKLIYQSQEQAIKASFGNDQKPEKAHAHEVRFTQGKDSVISTVAYMIIFGDGFHNFIDGVSIGAAFQQSVLTGISISLAVMCEELPHELGDFAVLLNSGMTMKQALFYNFLSATTCYVGMVIGILLGEFTETSSYIFALAGGMFLYIALVDMFPEMNETFTKALQEGGSEALKVLVLQNIGMFIGVFPLFFLAYYQDSLMIT